MIFFGMYFVLCCFNFEHKKRVKKYEKNGPNGIANCW